MAAVALCFGVFAPPATRAASESRTISLFNIHTKETVTVLFKKHGRYVPEGLEKASWALRDWRRNEATKMDPELIDLLWEIHRELGSREPVHIISGFRSRETNDMLRRSVGGQASESRHILGQAADVHFPDVSLKKLRYSALIRERGGVGYYPTSSIPFVHVDTGRVRHWPRLPRHELALLFPSGKSQHMPADGGAISKEDVQIAKARHGELAIQVAEFLNQRGKGGGSGSSAVAVVAPEPKPASRVASLMPLPKLVEPIAPAMAHVAMSGGPSAAERLQLTALASMAAAPRLVAGPRPAQRPPRPEGPASEGKALVAATGMGAASIGSATDTAPLAPAWVVAPAFDDDHPEELTYRPFPVAPLLTQSIDDPLLAGLVHPDVARALEMMDEPSLGTLLRIRPAPQVAALAGSSRFTGAAVSLKRLQELQAAGN